MKFEHIGVIRATVKSRKIPWLRSPGKPKHVYRPKPDKVTWSTDHSINILYAIKPRRTTSLTSIYIAWGDRP
jgi:hypothetical protein